MRVDLSRALEPLIRAQPAATADGKHSGHALPDPAKLWATIESDPRWMDWQEGRLDASGWHAHLTGRVNVSVPFDEFCAAWNRALDPVTILEERLFAELGAEYRLALLSNTDPLHSALLDEQYSFVRHFPVRIYSNRVGSSKPAEAIYRRALSELGVDAAEALFIDDIPQYAEAAGRIGMDAIRFENPAQLMGELRARGILRD